MFDDRNVEIPELEQLRAALVDSALARRQPPRRTRSVAISLAALVFVVAAVLLVSKPFGEKVGVQEALGGIAARIALVSDTPARAYTHSTFETENVVIVQPGFDRFMQPFAKFAAVSRLRFEFWLSRTRKGITRGHYLPPRFPSASDRATWNRVLAAHKKWQRLARTSEGRREYASTGKKYMDWAMKQMTITPFFDPLSAVKQSDEHGSITPDGKYHVGYITLTQREVDAFPREPRATYNRVRKLVTPQRNRDGGIDNHVWSTLTQGAGSFNDTLPSDLRAAFVAALQYLPGIEALGRETDSTGRPGDAFEWQFNGSINRIVFDARTAVPVELTSTLTEPEKAIPKVNRDLPKGTVTGRWLLRQTETTRSAPDR